MTDRPGQFFAWSELTRTNTGLPNDPGPVERDRLRRLCLEALDPIRRAVCRPVRVTSGYRSPAVNAAVGGSATSAHAKGLAADIKVEGLSAEELARIVVRVVSDLDQVIWYAPERGGHVHVGLRSLLGRRQTLHAPATGGYVPWTP